MTLLAPLALSLAFAYACPQGEDKPGPEKAPAEKATPQFTSKLSATEQQKENG